MDKIEIADLRGAPLSGLGYGGRAGRKEGIVIDGEPWIAKFPGSGRGLSGKHVPSYTASPACEYLGSHIYSLLGIPAHETVLGYYEGKIVCACRDFTWPDRRLIMFSDLKTQMDDDDTGFDGSPSDGTVTSLGDVLSTIDLARTISAIKGEAVARFWDMFVVDALIKNPDRNNGNWGFLWQGLGPGGLRLAPVYDNGSSLFAKRTDSVFESRMADERSMEDDAFSDVLSVYTMTDGDGKAHRIHPFDYMRSTANPDLEDAILRVDGAFDIAAIAELFASIPEEAYGRAVLSRVAAEANLALIQKRYEEGVAPLARGIRSRRAERPASLTPGMVGTAALKEQAGRGLANRSGGFSEAPAAPGRGRRA